MPVRGALSLPFLLLLSPSPSLGEDTGSVRTTSLPCPTQNIFQQLDHLSLENNQLDLQKRVKTDTKRDSEAQCRTTLTDLLLKDGEQTYYDRLSRALQHVGRTDIAIGQTQTDGRIDRQSCQSGDTNTELMMSH
ncbi:unnamed protein product [Coregonus sp. 'balchen']|nr:unnamed protein product [Coregonus sp. 'balchen']